MIQTLILYSIITIYWYLTKIYFTSSNFLLMWIFTKKTPWGNVEKLSGTHDTRTLKSQKSSEWSIPAGFISKDWWISSQFYDIWLKWQSKIVLQIWRARACQLSLPTTQSKSWKIGFKISSRRGLISC